MPTHTTIPGAVEAASEDRGFTRVPLALTGAHVRVTGAACVKTIATRTAKTGSTYLDVTLSHADGQTVVKVWSSDMPTWASITEGAAVTVTLESKIGWRPGTFEWALQDVTLLADDHPIRDDLLPQCPVPSDELTERWDALVARLTPAGSALLDVVLEHVGRDLCDRMAAAERMHHAVVGGLKWHSVEVAEFALAMAGAVPGYQTLIEVDALIVGALLHDIGKCLEMSVDRGIGIRRAPEGWARYHTTLGPEIVAVACALAAKRLTTAGVSATAVAHLKHVCESHHGDKREHGSPTPPRSIEAWLVHAADLASARARQLSDDMVGLTRNNEGWLIATDGRRTPVFVPSDRAGAWTAPVAEGSGADMTTAIAGVTPPRPPAEPPNLHLVVLRDTATAVPIIPTPTEDA